MRHALFFACLFVSCLFGSATGQGLWEPDGAMLAPRSRHVAVPLADGSVLAVGGLAAGGETLACELYDPRANAWSATCGTLNQSRVDHTATLLDDGRVLVAGGTSLGLPLRSAEIYDPASRAFTGAGQMGSPRFGHTATLLRDGRVFVVGGQTPGAIPPRAELFDPATGTWTVVAAPFPMGNAGYRRFHTAEIVGASVDGVVLVCGGLDSATAAPMAGSFFYNPNPPAGQPTYAGGPPLNTARYGHRMVQPQAIANTPFLIVGGVVASGLPTASCELFQFLPGNVAFLQTGALNTPRRAHTATYIREGVVVLGGTAGAVGAPLGSGEVFDPVNRTWRFLSPPMPLVRQDHTATALDGDKSILVAGGLTGAGQTAQTDAYLGLNAVHVRLQTNTPQPIPDGGQLVYDILVANLTTSSRLVRGTQALNGIQPFYTSPTKTLPAGQVVRRLGNAITLDLGAGQPLNVMYGLNYLHVRVVDVAAGFAIGEDFLTFCLVSCPGPCP